MGVRFPFNFASISANVTLVTTATTILVTLPPLSPPLDNATVLVCACCEAVWGTTTSSVLIQLQRGPTLTGALITGLPFGVTQAVTAGTRNTICVFGYDQPGAVGGIQYNLNLGQVGATANGTVESAVIMAFVL